jgi:hypothetical protein
MPRVLIATPATSGIVRLGYCVSLAGLVRHMTERRLEPVYLTNEGSVLPQQRDYLATWFLDAKEFTHLLFVDSDMTFPNDLAERLLSLEKEMVGAIYPTRDNVALVAAPFTPMKVHEGGLYKLEGIGFGFVLISRPGLERLAQTVHKYTYTNPTADPRPVYRLFAPIERNPPIGEDYSFCERWIAAGGEVWGYADSRIGHIGDTVARRKFPPLAAPNPAG